MKRYGVRPSVCSIRPLQQRAVGLLLWARRTGDIDRLLRGAAGAQLQLRPVSRGQPTCTYMGLCCFMPVQQTPGRRDRTLPDRSSNLVDCNFIIRMLYLNAY